MAPDPPPILGLDIDRVSNRLMSPLRIKVVALVDETKKLTARNTLESDDMLIGWVSRLRNKSKVSVSFLLTSVWYTSLPIAHSSSFRQAGGKWIA